MNLRVGSRGQSVLSLQQKLEEAGFSPGPLDGKFGPLTQRAVRAFQEARGLQVDGIAGPATAGALGLSGFDAPPPRVDGTAPPGRPPGGSGTGTTQEFLWNALGQQGKSYVFGAETNLNDPNPQTFDCSELVEWAAARAGVRFPDGSAAQIDAARPMSVEEALRTPGALLYRPGHIAISLGDGRTIEARGRRYGVGIFSAEGRGWTRAGTIPGLS
ncbi:MAG: peptidoglycan-binding protein [Myxococcaceae bacterium]|jgi:cell wall-associated NlpC family hydrolase|nr:peptidoglycan-binding protein [Myxococcaceae bacterium]